MKRIHRWLSKKGVTHLLLDGGTLSVKPEDEEDFFVEYVNDIRSGEKLYVVEQKTTRFRFFVDVDFVCEDGYDVDFMSVGKVISKIVNMGKCVLAKASPRRINGTSIKHGLHIIWPDTSVTKQKAQTIRMNILDQLGHDEWDKVIDPNVYAGSGLRMIWSLKKCDEPPYIPWGYIIRDEFIEFTSKEPSVDLLRLFSIRSTSASSSTQDDEVNSDEHHHTADLESFIQKNVKGQESAKIVRLSMCKNKKDWWIGTNSRFCENIKKCHKSNHVWFCLTPLGVLTQRCLDEECKKFVGRKYRIPSRLVPNERSVARDPGHSIIDYFPDGWIRNSARHIAIGKVRSSGAEALEQIQK